MHFRIRGQAPEHFRHLIGLDRESLSEHGARRQIVTEKPGFPCRISLVDAEIGESVLLLNFEHHSAATPYRAAGPVFVRESAARAFDAIGTVPPMLRGRLLSVRAYDADGMMRDADVVDGARLERLVDGFFELREVAYLHAHFAKRGCFACRIERA